MAAGATLLATDGAGNDLIARSANGIIDANLFPSISNNNAEFYDRLANTLTPSPVPEPTSLVLWGTIGAFVAFGIKRRLA